MTPPKFVITGTGRCGTGYIAAVLNASGLRCGHENWFTPTNQRTGGLDGDSSWCAVPELPAFTGTVFHQVRDPLAVVASLTNVPPHGAWDQLRRRVVPIQDELPVERAMRIYCTFNENTEPYAVMRWRVEDVDADLVEKIGAMIGRPVWPHVSISRTTNCHNQTGPFRWEDLPAGELRERLARLAYRYGYL